MFYNGNRNANTNHPLIKLKAGGLDNDPHNAPENQWLFSIDVPDQFTFY